MCNCIITFFFSRGTVGSLVYLAERAMVASSLNNVAAPSSLYADFYGACEVHNASSVFILSEGIRGAVKIDGIATTFGTMVNTGFSNKNLISSSLPSCLATSCAHLSAELNSFIFSSKVSMVVSSCLMAAWSFLIDSSCFLF